MSPLAAELSARLTLDAEVLTGARPEFFVTIDGLALDTQERWIPAAVPHIGVVVRVTCPDFAVVAQLPPTLLGLSRGSPEDEETPKVAASEGFDPGKPSRRSPSQPVTTGDGLEVARVGPAGWRVRFHGTLASGRRLGFELDGAPGRVSVSVVATQGRPVAEALLKPMLHQLGLTGGELEESTFGDPGDETLSLRWTSAALEAPAQAPTPLPEALATRPEAVAAEVELEPTASEPLYAGGRLHAIEGAALTLEVRCDRRSPGEERPVYSVDHVRLGLRLEVTVDEHSGEDGALAPSFDFSARALPFELPRGGGRRALLDSDGATEGWLGNDSDELVEHDFAFRLISATEAEVWWRASVATGQATPSFLSFRGRCALTAVVSAPSEALLPEVLRRAFGEQALEAWAPLEPEPQEWLGVPFVRARLRLGSRAQAPEEERTRRPTEF